MKVSNTCASFQIELSAEAKAALLEFEERERQHKQGRYGSRRGGRRGGSSLCRGVGDQRRESSDRARGKEPRPALLPTQPPVLVSPTVPSWAPAPRNKGKDTLVGIIFCVYLSLKWKLSVRNNGSPFFFFYDL